MNTLLLKRLSILLSIFVVMNTFGEHARPGTPAEKKIENAKKRIAKDSDNWQAYNSLAMAYALRARETHNPDYYVSGGRCFTAII